MKMSCTNGPNGSRCATCEDYVAGAKAAREVRYYSLPNIKGEGWAIAVVNTRTGFFAVDSDFGRYVYTWDSMGVPDTRQFLIGCDTHYLCSKFMMGRPNGGRDFDCEASVAAVRKLIEEAWPEGSDERNDELELLARADFDCEAGRALWHEESQVPNRFSDWYEELVYVPNRQCMAFLKRVWPRLVALWKAELPAKGTT